MRVQLLLRPAANCTVSSLVISSFLLLQIAFLKNLVALQYAGTLAGTTYQLVQFVDYFCWFIGFAFWSSLQKLRLVHMENDVADKVSTVK